MQEETIRDGRLLITKLGPLGPLANNVYVIADAETSDAVIIDAPEGSEAIAAATAGLNVRRAIITHRHRDHWAGIDALLRDFDVPVLCHEADREPYAQYVSDTLADGHEVEVGSLRLRVLHTPGHTPGCICLHFGDHMITGDTLFPGGPGRTRTNDDLQQEIESIVSRLYVLPDSVQVYPGHGANTTIGVSKQEYQVFASKTHAADLAGDVAWLTS